MPTQQRTLAQINAANPKSASARQAAPGEGSILDNPIVVGSTCLTLGIGLGVGTMMVIGALSGQ